MRPKPDLIFNGRPAVLRSAEAWRLDDGGVWQRIHPAEVFVEAEVVGADKLLRLFGRLPALPREAFS